MNNDELSFGQLIQKLRREQGWLVKDFIQRLGGEISPAYITRIEQYDEIPRPELIYKIADIFNYDQEELLEKAKEGKRKRFEESLDKKYQVAFGFCRTHKGKEGATHK